MTAFVELEQLRSATKSIQFKAAHPDSKVKIEMMQDFIANNEAKVLAEMGKLWPGVKKKDIKHWSLKNTRERCKLLGMPFEEWYELQFQRLSWYVHSGLTGVVNLSADTFNAVGGIALSFITITYCRILEFVIKEFRIDMATSKIHKLMKYAQMVSFTDNAVEAEQLLAELLS
jgi:hypothetical protein